MSLFRMDPGPCLICGAAHTTCTATTGAPTVSLLRMRDAVAARGDDTGAAPSSTSEAATLGDGSDARPFSTASYRGKGKRAR